MGFITVIIYVSIYLGLVATTFFILSFFYDKKREKLKFEDNHLPDVVVIIPAYNEEKSIGKTIESILASDYPNFKVFVIDDGSRDKTFELAKKFESDRVKVFHKENGGKGSALNFGIEKAKTDFVFIMDSDTTVHPQAIRRMIKYFKDKEAT